MLLRTGVISRAVVVLALTGAAVRAQTPAAAGRAFAPADWYRVTTLSQPAMSPDGSRIAFTVQTVLEGENRRHQEVWMVPAAGGPAQRLTSPGYESSAPRWSRDGSTLYFSSTRPGGRGNTWALRMNQPGEAAQVADEPTGSTPADKRFVVFTALATDSSAPPAGEGRGGGGRGGRGGGAPTGAGVMARPPYDAITKPLDQTRFDGMHITAQRFVANGQGYVPSPGTRPTPPRPQQIFVQMLDGSPRKQLTNTIYSHRNVVVSPDGKWIAFVADAKLRSDSAVQAEADSIALLPFDKARDQAPRNDADIFVLPIDGGEPRRLGEYRGSEASVQWSPDGTRLSFLAAHSRTTHTRLWVVPVAGGTPRNVLGNWRYEPSGYDWTGPDEITFAADIGGRSALHSLSVQSGQFKELLSGRRRISGFTYDNAHKTVAYISTAVNKPTELFIANRDGTGERQLTTFNDALNREVAWADAERFTYPSVGGLEIEGWLMKPYGYQAGKKYPLVLYIHGGPHAQYNEGWFDEFQNLAGMGFMVLYTNPRGSSGYGADFTFSTRGRWFAEDYQDLMKSVDIVAQRPDVDSTRMGVTGGSYGGVMTAWVTVKTNRFKAAQADRMISNWWSWYGSSDAQGLTEFEFFGRPWDNPAMYDSLSPIRYVGKVKTPTFVLQSEDDHRTPITDAEQWFLGLKKHGVAAEFVRYPRSTHDLSRTGEPWLLVDRLHRLRGWFAHWLKPEPIAAANATSSGAGQ